jgi:predicted nucleic acid-binding protein
MTHKKKKPDSAAVLIDTPLWREYFRREEKVFQQINALMDAGRVCSMDLIIAELVDGAANEKERKAFRDFARIFPILREPEGVWTQAAEWARKMQKKEAKPALRDAFIAFMAVTHGVLLWTRNPLWQSFRLPPTLKCKFFYEPGVQE